MLGNIADSQATLTKAEEQLKEWWSQEPNRMQITVEDLFECVLVLGLRGVLTRVPLPRMQVVQYPGP